jgi:hypothetical protein
MSDANTQPASPDTTVGELRKQHGPHFAKGYGDNDKLGQVLARAGAGSLEEYLKRNRQGDLST